MTELDAAPTAARSSARKARPWLIAGLVLAAVAASFAGYVLLRPDDSPGDAVPAITIDGRLDLLGGHHREVGFGGCGGTGGYEDLQQGTQVIITDAAGTTIAIGKLAAGLASATGGCTFSFDIRNVPGGHQFYGVEVSHRGRLQYSAADVQKDLKLSLGS